MATSKGLLLTAAGRYRPVRGGDAGVAPASPGSDRLVARVLEALAALFPVHHVPPRLEVVRALVLVLEVVGVLPDVDAEQGCLARGDRRVLVRCARHLEPAAGAVVDEPRPAAAELADAGRVHLLLELVEAAEGLGDRAGERAARVTAAVGAHDLPEEGVVRVAACVVAYGRALVVRQAVEVLEHLFDRL